jgi:hypothetical protein
VSSPASLSFRNVATQFDAMIFDPVKNTDGFFTRDGTASQSEIRFFRFEIDSRSTFDSGVSGSPEFVYDAPNFGVSSDGDHSTGSIPNNLDCSNGCGSVRVGAELQSLTLASVEGSFVGGSVALSYLGASTTCVNVDATAAEWAAALNALPAATGNVEGLFCHAPHLFRWCRLPELDDTVHLVFRPPTIRQRAGLGGE